MITQIITNFLQILVWPVTQHNPVSVPKLKSFGPSKTELWAKIVGELAITLHGEMAWWIYFCPPTWLPNYKCTEIF